MVLWIYDFQGRLVFLLFEPFTFLPFSSFSGSRFGGSSNPRTGTSGQMSPYWIQASQPGGQQEHLVGDRYLVWAEPKVVCQ